MTAGDVGAPRSAPDGGSSEDPKGRGPEATEPLALRASAEQLGDGGRGHVPPELTRGATRAGPGNAAQDQAPRRSGSGELSLPRVVPGPLEIFF